MKKIVPKILALIVCIVLLSSFVTREKYDLSIRDYLRYSAPITPEEAAYLEEKEKLVYGCDANAAPLSFTDEETGQNTGFIIDYMTSLSIELGTEVEYRPMVWNTIITKLKDQQIDMSDLFKSEERAKDFLFTQTIYELKGVIVTNKYNPSIQQEEDICNQTVAVISGDYCEELIEKKYGDTVTLVRVSSVEPALEKLMSGEVDAIAGDAAVINYYAEQDETVSNSIRILKKPIYTEGVTLAVSKDNRELVDILNKGILMMKKKNILTQTQEKWFGSSNLSFKDLNSFRWLSMGVILIISLSILASIWEWHMEKKINEKTEDIRSRESLLMAMMNALHLYIIVIDSEGRIITNNRMTCDFLKKESIAGENIIEQPILGEIYSKALEGHQKIIKYKSSYYETNIRAIEENNTRLVIFEDITQRTLAERKLRQDSKIIAIGELTAGLAHEIRNPLGLIKNYKFIFSKYATDDMSKHALDVINNSVDRINELVDNLLNFSRLGTDEIKEVDIRQVFESVMMLENKKAEQNGIQIIKNMDEKIIIHTNEESVRIVLFNLIDNAIDAYAEIDRPDKVIDISIRMQDDGRASIIVKDYGAGMSEQTIEELFNPFFTTKKTGTGLGLYIVQSEINKISGSIKIDSEQNRGTVFKVKLPDKLEEGGNL